MFYESKDRQINLYKLKREGTGLERITLGKTELKVSPICLGGGSYGGSVKEPQAREQLDHLRELGGNFVDTAVIYCDWFEGERSSSQNMIGRWLKDRK